jgi:hypothetical protein
VLAPQETRAGLPEDLRPPDLTVQGLPSGARVRRFATVGRQGGSRERHPGPCAKTLCVPQHRNPIAGAVPQPRPESFSGPPDLELPVTAILPGAAAPCPVRTGSITARRGKECPHHARVAERGDKFFWKLACTGPCTQ